MTRCGAGEGVGAAERVPVLDGQVRQFAAKLGFAIETAKSVWAQFPFGVDDLSLYEAVRGLSDHDLTGLIVWLSALFFGQDRLPPARRGDSLFNPVSRDFSVDMRYHWRPDRAS